MAGTITLTLDDEYEFWAWTDAADRLDYTSLENFIVAAVRAQMKEGDRHEMHAQRQAIGMKTI